MERLTKLPATLRNKMRSPGRHAPLGPCGRQAGGLINLDQMRPGGRIISALIVGVRRRGEFLLLALFGHPTCTDECPLLGAKRSEELLLIRGAAWGPQKDRMASAIYFPLFLVLVGLGRANYSIFYLSADLQEPSMFRPRSPLSPKARRAGWQGFIYDLGPVRDRFVRIR